MYIYICVYIFIMYIHMSHSCTDNHIVINIYIHKRHIYVILVYMHVSLLHIATVSYLTLN